MTTNTPGCFVDTVVLCSTITKKQPLPTVSNVTTAETQLVIVYFFTSYRQGDRRRYSWSTAKGGRFVKLQGTLAKYTLPVNDLKGTITYTVEDSLKATTVQRLILQGYTLPTP